VTGATGFTGTHLCRRLAALGARLRGIARAESRTDALRDVAIRWYRGEVDDPALICEACEGVEYVFHLAAAYRTAGRPDDYYRRVHLDSTQALARAVLGRPEFQRFVHVSTIGVHGHIEGPPGDESTPFDPGDVYQATKADAEQWLARFAGERALPFVILRPCAIYGPGDRRLLKLFRMAARGFFVALGPKDTLYHLIHVEDLVDIICLAAVHDAADGQVFIAGNPDALPMSRIVGIIGRTLDRQVRVVRLPVMPVYWLAAACEWVCGRLGLEPPLHRRRVAFYMKDRAFDTSKLRRCLGYEYRYNDEDGLAATTTWYLQQGWIR
jgi:nucleoside-diphosphate-sugar epimerase